MEQLDANLVILALAARLAELPTTQQKELSQSIRRSRRACEA
jgi:hypothetical protein